MNFIRRNLAWPSDVSWVVARNASIAVLNVLKNESTIKMVLNFYGAGDVMGVKRIGCPCNKGRCSECRICKSLRSEIYPWLCLPLSMPTPIS